MDVTTDSAELVETLNEFGDYIRTETLADELAEANSNTGDGVDFKIGDIQLNLIVRKA